MGQYQAGLLAAWLTDWCGVEHLRRFAVRFTAPVLLGSAEIALSERSLGDGLPLGRLA